MVNTSWLPGQQSRLVVTETQVNCMAFHLERLLFVVVVVKRLVSPCNVVVVQRDILSCNVTVKCDILSCNVTVKRDISSCNVIF